MPHFIPAALNLWSGPVRYQTIMRHGVYEFGTSPLQYQSCRVQYWQFC